MATWIGNDRGGQTTRDRTALPKTGGHEVAEPPGFQGQDGGPLDARPPSETRTRPSIRKATVARHLVLSAILWVVYLTYWKVVLSRGIGQEALISLAVIVFFILGVYTGTQLWVSHNQRIARRLEGRRVERPLIPSATAEDFLGRRYELPSETDLRFASRVIVEVEGDVKRLRVESPVGVQCVEDEAC